MDLEEGKYEDFTKHGFNLENFADANKALCIIFVILILIANILLMIKNMTKGNFLLNQKSLTIISMATGDVFLALFALTLKAEVFFKGFGSLSCGSLKSSWAYTNYLLNFVYGMGLVTLAAEIVYRHKTQGIDRSKVYRLVSSLLFSSAPWVLGVVIVLPLVLVNIDSVTCQSYRTKDQMKAQVMVSIMLPAIAAVLTSIVLKCQIVQAKDRNSLSTVLRSQDKLGTYTPVAHPSRNVSSPCSNQECQAKEIYPPNDNLKPRRIFAITHPGIEISAVTQALQPTAPAQTLHPTATMQNGHFPYQQHPQTQLTAQAPNLPMFIGAQYVCHRQQPEENNIPPLNQPNTLHRVYVNPAFQSDHLGTQEPNTADLGNIHVHGNSTHESLQQSNVCPASQLLPALHHPNGFIPVTQNHLVETSVPLSTSGQYPYLTQHILQVNNQDPAQQISQQAQYPIFPQPNSQQHPYPIFPQLNSQQPPYPILPQPDSQQASYPILPYSNSEQIPYPLLQQPIGQQPPYPIPPQQNSQQPPYPILPNSQQPPYPILPQPSSQQSPYPIFPQPSSQQLPNPIIPQPNNQQLLRDVPAQPNSQHFLNQFSVQPYGQPIFNSIFGQQNSQQHLLNPTTTVQNQVGLQVAPNSTTTVQDQVGLQVDPNSTTTVQDQVGLQVDPTRSVLNQDGLLAARIPIDKANPRVRVNVQNKEKNHLLAASVLFFLLVMPYAIFDISQPAMAVTSLVLLKEIVTWLMVGRSVVTPCVMFFYDGN